MGRYGLASGNAYYWISSLPPVFIAQVFGRDSSRTCTESEQVPGLWNCTVNSLYLDSTAISCSNAQYHFDECVASANSLCALASDNRCHWTRHYSPSAYLA